MVKHQLDQCESCVHNKVCKYRKRFSKAFMSGKLPLNLEVGVCTEWVPNDVAMAQISEGMATDIASAIGNGMFGIMPIDTAELEVPPELIVSIPQDKDPKEAIEELIEGLADNGKFPREIYVHPELMVTIGEEAKDMLPPEMREQLDSEDGEVPAFIQLFLDGRPIRVLKDDTLAYRDFRVVF